MAGEELSLAELVEVLRHDQSQRWVDGEPCAAETYFERHPRLLADATSAMHLVYNEVLLREVDDESPQLEEYLRRFPQFADQLTPLFEIHRALESDQLLSPDETTQAPTRHHVDPETPRPGRTFAGHEILEEVGRGGMGVVYKARHIGLNRVVALKMILAGSHASPEQLARFRAEAEAVARLQHPNIVQVHEVGEEKGRPYFSMEFVNGGSLAQVLHGTPQPVQWAANLIQVLARTMHVAHQTGIIHRDLKPANILMQKDEGRRMKDEEKQPPQVASAYSLPFILHPSSFILPKITDFGLAKQLDADTAQTGSGTILGTPSYMAPEQADGKFGEIGPAADVYALGAIFYELLTGRPPFKAETQLETLHQVLHDEPVPLSRLLVRVPRDLDTICMKCLQKEPHLRYGSALSLAEDLERFLADQPIHARRSGSLERTWRWCRRNPSVAGLGTAVASLIICIAIGASFTALWLERARQNAVKDLASVERAEEATRAELTSSQLERARARRRSGEGGQRFDSLQMLSTLASNHPTAAQRSEAIASMALVDLGETRVLTGDQSEFGQPGFDPRLEFYACGDEHGNLIVRCVADEKEIKQLEGPGCGAHMVHFSPNGRYLAVKYYLGYADYPKEYRVWEWRTGRLLLQRPSVNMGECLDFSPDSRLLVLEGSERNSLDIFNLETLRDVNQVKLDCAPEQVAFHPKGKLLATSSADAIRLHELETGKTLETWTTQDEWFLGLAWRSDGQQLAGAGSSGRIKVWNMTTGESRLLEGHRRTATRVMFSHSGSLLASCGWDDTTRLWDTQSGNLLVRASGQFIQFSPDDSLLAYNSHSQRGIWKVAQGEEYRALHGHRTVGRIGPWNVAFNSDGTLLASSDVDGVRIWDTEGAHEVAHLPLGKTYSALFPSGCGSLLTSGSRGLFRWPLQPGAGETAGRSCIGPPVAIDIAATRRLERMTLDSRGSILAVADREKNQATFVDLATGKSSDLQRHDNISAIALSQEGRWLATGTFKGTNVRIWDLKARKVVKELPCVSAEVWFCPGESEWLVVGTLGVVQFFRVGTWLPGPRIAAAGNVAAFTSDGRIGAFADTDYGVKLVYTSSGEEIARIAAPDPQVILALCFSPDGGLLAIANMDHVVRLWDIRKIRQGLAKMNLDWDPPLAPSNRSSRPRVRIDVRLSADLFLGRAHEHYLSKEFGSAIEDYRKSLEIDPKQSGAKNSLAWLYATGPASMHDLKQALRLAQEATQQEPQSTTYQNTLGVVLHRLGRYPEAIAALEKNVPGRSGDDAAPFDWLFLAMSHQALGHTDKARACYFRALQSKAKGKITADDREECVLPARLQNLAPA